MMWADFVIRGTLVLAAGFAASYAAGRASAALVETLANPIVSKTGWMRGSRSR